MDPEEESTDQPETPAAAPAAPALDLSAIEALLTSTLDKRLSGFQSMLDRKTGDLAAEINSLKTANLSPEEQEQQAILQERARVQALERENALLKMRKQHPEEVDFLEGFFGATTLEEQLALLASFRKAKAEGSEEPEEPATPVKANNPSRGARPTVADDTEMTAELADALLDAADQPGFLHRVRKLVNG